MYRVCQASVLEIQFNTLKCLWVLPDGLPLGNNFPYFPESMKHYYIIRLSFALIDLPKSILLMFNALYKKSIS